jgi:hypothetical protein
MLKFLFYFKNIIECASMCSHKYYCSAFNFDPEQNVCSLGSTTSTTATPSTATITTKTTSATTSSTTTTPQLISVYLNPNYVDRGEFVIILNRVLFMSHNTQKVPYI